MAAQLLIWVERPSTTGGQKGVEIEAVIRSPCGLFPRRFISRLHLAHRPREIRSAFWNGTNLPSDSRTNEAAKLLEETFEEEMAANQKLTFIAQKVNVKAQQHA